MEVYQGNGPLSLSYGMDVFTWKERLKATQAGTPIHLREANLSEELQGERVFPWTPNEALMDVGPVFQQNPQLDTISRAMVPPDLLLEVTRN